jgi:hypothetical protein
MNNLNHISPLLGQASPWGLIFQVERTTLPFGRSKFHPRRIAESSGIALITSMKYLDFLRAENVANGHD